MILYFFVKVSTSSQYFTFKTGDARHTVAYNTELQYINGEDKHKLIIALMGSNHLKSWALVYVHDFYYIYLLLC